MKSFLSFAVSCLIGFCTPKAIEIYLRWRDRRRSAQACQPAYGLKSQVTNVTSHFQQTFPDYSGNSDPFTCLCAMGIAIFHRIDNPNAALYLANILIQNNRELKALQLNFNQAVRLQYDSPAPKAPNRVN